MKVLYQGTLPSEETFVGSCTHCKTKVEFKRSEAQYVHDPRDGGALRVNCPTCSNDIFASEDQNRWKRLRE